MSSLNYIKSREKDKNHFSWNGVEVFVKDPIETEGFSLRDCFEEISSKIPKHFLVNVEAIYIGQFDNLKERELQALYENSSIFVTNIQDSHEDFIDDIVHEIAHAVEEVAKFHIYSDGKLEEEFLTKRKSLFSVLKSEGYSVDLHSYLTADYSLDFDEHLYREIGYPALDLYSSNIFYSPYAATSLNEYFANGFEAFYYFGDIQFLKNNCKILYKKLELLMDKEYDKEY